jgi:PAS domain S-box-containing protein
MATPLRVLLIEDNEDDADLLLRELRRGGYALDWQRVDTAGGLLAALAAREWDLITCDYVMPQFSAPAALKHIRASGLDLPVIIVSGQVGEEVAVTAMKAGAHDYISKHRMARLLPAIERELAEAASRRARRDAEATLRASEEKYRELVEAVHDVIFEVDATGAVTFISPAVTPLSGYRPAELAGRSLFDFIHPDDLPAVLDSFRRTLSGTEEPAEFRVLDRAGAVHWVRTFGHVGVTQGGLPRLRGVLTDITERREAEDASRIVVEQSVVGLAVVQGECIVLANPALAALCGRWVEDLVGQPIADLATATVHPDDRPRVLTVARTYLDGGPPSADQDFRIVRPDGSVRRVLTTQSDFRYRGAPARLIAYMDITHRTQAEATYRDIFEHSLQGLVVVQGNRYAMVNPAFAEIFGLTREECQGVAMEEIHQQFIHPDDRAEVERVAGIWLERGEVAPPFEYRLVRRDGTVRLVHCRASRIEFEGKPAALVAVTDLTDRRRAEEIYRAVFDHSLQGLVVLQGARYVLANRALADLMGIAPEELATLTPHDIRDGFIHPDDRERFDRYLTDWLRNGAVPDAPYELRVIRADAQERSLHCQATRIDLDGAPAVLIAFADVTERRRAEEAYRAIFEHSLQGLIVVRGRRVLMANRAMEGLTSYSIDEYTRMTVEELLERLVHPDDQSALRSSYERTLSSGETSQRREFRIIRKDGGVRRLLTARSAISFADKPAVLVAHVDITERWQAEEALRALNADLEARVAERTAQLEAAARELESFNDSVSHDLRAPLRAIDGYVQGVLSDYAALLPVDARHDLERVRRAARRMAELIDHLLSLSRVIGDELRRVPVNLSALAHEVLQELAGRQPERRVAVTIADDLRADGDTALLRAVLANLLGNAWKFTTPQPQPRIEVGAVAGEPSAFYVRDNGVGFDMHDAARLFRPFQRLHAASEFDGNGIGLATVARIIARHGGRVWAEAAVGEGATFYFSLPLPTAGEIR